MFSEHSALWQLYRETGDLTARDTLIKDALGLVHSIARKLRFQLGDTVSHEDLVSAGMVGLMEAVAAFDPTRGFAFSTFAAQRIRGAILDDRRASDPLSRQARQQCQQLTLAERAVRRRVHRSPSAIEIAAELNVDLDTYWEWKGFAQYDDQESIHSEESGLPGLAERIGRDSGIEEKLEEDGRATQLRNALLALSERDRTVVSLYYFEELKQREIAAVLEISEGRVSQILSSTLKKLRGHLVNESGMTSAA